MSRSAYPAPTRNRLLALHQRAFHPVGASSARPGGVALAGLVPALMADLACAQENVHTMSDTFATALAPVFCLRFHPSASFTTALSSQATSAEHRRHDAGVVAVGDEDGWVSFIHPSVSNHFQTHATRHRFHAHENAIFDMQWIGSGGAAASNSHSIVTASGDQTVRAWDVETGACLYKLVGHQGSVKTVRSQPGSPDVLVTGARDGKILLYDLREARAAVAPMALDLEDGVKPHYRLEESHISATTAKTKRKRASSSTAEQSVGSASVTSLCFASPNVLLSGGAADSDVRAWDLRTMRSKFKSGATVVASLQSTASSSSSSSSAASRKKKASHSTFTPLYQLSPSSEDGASSLTRSGGQRQYGIASLAMDPSGQRLLVSSRDHILRLYDLPSTVTSPSTLRPTQTFTGHSCANFYSKATFSPCGRFVSSGSTDARGYLWDTMAKRTKPTQDPLEPAARKAEDATSIRPLKILAGHRSEVNEVEWNPHASSGPLSSSSASPWADMLGHQLLSCSDDSTVRVWNWDASATTRKQELGDIVDVERQRQAPAGLRFEQMMDDEHDEVEEREEADARRFDQLTHGSNRLSNFVLHRAHPPEGHSLLHTPPPAVRRAHGYDAFASPDTHPASGASLTTTMTHQSMVAIASPPVAAAAASSSSASPAAATATLLNAPADQDLTATTMPFRSSRDRSLSPADRRMTSSSLLASARAAAGATNETEMSDETAALERQLTKSLTVSPSKVVLAREAHSRARHRHRADAIQESGLGASPVKPTAPTTNRFAARLQAVSGQTLPTIMPPSANAMQLLASFPVTGQLFARPITSFAPAAAAAAAASSVGTPMMASGRAQTQPRVAHDAHPVPASMAAAAAASTESPTATTPVSPAPAPSTIAPASARDSGHRSPPVVESPAPAVAPVKRRAMSMTSKSQSKKSLAGVPKLTSFFRPISSSSPVASSSSVASEDTPMLARTV